MYKSRPFMWLITVGVILCVCLFQGFIGCVTHETPQYNLYCESSDNLLRKNLGNCVSETFKFNIYDTINGSDIVITEPSNKDIPGYVKYNNYIYTPIVMFARRECLEEKSGFTVYNSGSTASTAYKDLYPILVAIEEGKQFADIGISKNVATGTVKLYLPSSNSPYYNAVVDTIYATLNNGVPTDAQRKILEPRVNDILSKCEYVEDVGSTIVDLYNKDDKTYTLFLGPENTIGISKNAFNSGNNGGWNIVYLNKTCNYNFDLYIRECEEQNTLLSVITSKTFTYYTRCRVYNTNHMYDSYNHTAKTIATF